MSPPKLAADAPILDVLHPMVVHLAPTLREKSHLPTTDNFTGWLCARILQEPLFGQARFNWYIRTFAVAYIVLVRLILVVAAKFLQFFCCGFAGGKTVHASE